MSLAPKGGFQINFKDGERRDKAVDGLALFFIRKQGGGLCPMQGVRFFLIPKGQTERRF